MKRWFKPMLLLVWVVALICGVVHLAYGDDTPTFNKEQVQKIMTFQKASAAIQKQQQEVQSIITDVCKPPKWQYALIPNSDNSAYVPGCVPAPPPPPQK